MIFTIDKPNILGESPIWNHFNNTYYWVDIEDYKIKKFDDFYKEYDIQFKGIKVKPTCLALIDSNKIFTVVEDGFGIYDFREKNGFKYVYIPEFVDENFRKNLRFNDGKCDRKGNLYIGTMDLNIPRKPIGTIYKLTPDLNTIPIFENISVTNGISFTTNNYSMFFYRFILSCHRTHFAFEVLNHLPKDLENFPEPSLSSELALKSCARP